MKTKDEYNMSLDQPLSSTLPKIAPCMSFPRKRESIGLTMGPRFRGDDDADFHFHRWAEGPWKLLRAARQWPEAPAKDTPRRRAAEEGKMRPPLLYFTREIDERSGNVDENKGRVQFVRAAEGVNEPNARHPSLPRKSTPSPGPRRLWTAPSRTTLSPKGERAFS